MALLSMIWMSCLVVFLIAISNLVVVSAQQEKLLQNFAKPANLFNIAETPWMFINEFSNEREEAGKLSLLNIDTEDRVDFPSPLIAAEQLSYFADPSCEPNSLDEISPHGNDGILRDDIGVGKWEIAIVNHFGRESIEFYLLDVDTANPTLTSMGCTVLSTKQDAHNAVSYSPDRKFLAVSLYYQTFYGILGTLNYVISFFRGQVLPGGDGGLKIMSEGGAVELVKKGLNGANGVIYQDRVFVAENPRGIVQAIDPETGEAETALEAAFPDNMSRYEDNSFLVTRIDTPFPKVVYCSFQSLVFEVFCELEFSVIRVFYDYSNEAPEVIYSSAVEWQVTQAVIKEGDLFVGNYETDYMLRVEGLVV